MLSSLAEAAFALIFGVSIFLAYIGLCGVY